MPSILEILQQQLGGGVTDQISRHVGVDRSTIGTALSAALPLLIGALSRNTSSPAGAAELHQELSTRHDGSILDRLGGLVGQQPGALQGDGSRILPHLFGPQQDTVERRLSQTTGLNVGQVGSLLAMLAPIVLGALGKVQRQGNLDAGSLHDVLAQEKEHIARRAPDAMSSIESWLDADKDGDVDLDDLRQKGLGALGGLFGG